MRGGATGERSWSGLLSSGALEKLEAWATPCVGPGMTDRAAGQRSLQDYCMSPRRAESQGRGQKQGRPAAVIGVPDGDACDGGGCPRPVKRLVGLAHSQPCRSGPGAWRRRDKPKARGLDRLTTSMECLVLCNLVEVPRPDKLDREASWGRSAAASLGNLVVAQLVD